MLCSVVLWCVMVLGGVKWCHLVWCVVLCYGVLWSADL